MAARIMKSLTAAALAAPLMLAACGDSDVAEAPDAEADVAAMAADHPDPASAAPAAAAASQAAMADGEAVYRNFCAACHEDPADDSIPPRAAVAELSPDEIVATLRTGVMRIQGDALTDEQHVAVAEYLTGREVSGGVELSEAAMCAADAPIPAGAEAGWNGWGRTPANTRFADAGITAEDLPNLRLKWAFGIPDATQMRAQPAVYGGRVFFGSQPGMVYSVDAESGCVRWAFQAQGGVRTAISVGPVTDGSGAAVFFTDATATAYSVDAGTGDLRWTAKLDDHAAATGTGAPTLYDGVLYAPVTGVSEESTAAAQNYECCTFRGSITALDAETGETIWKTYTTPPAEPRGTNEAGQQLWGPAGVGVWSAPTIDADRGLLYAATGNAYADPDPGTSDSVIALDLASGDFAWVTQLHSDVWIMGCSAPPPGAPGAGGGAPGPNENCPDMVGPDFDFSASPALTDMPDGRQVLAVTQKSGLAYGLDPAAEGELLWTFRWGRGSGIGGVWGTATDGERAYFAVADVGSDQAGGVHAVDPATGEQIWFAPHQTPLCQPGPGCSSVQSAAVTAIPGAVLSGSADGGMRAYDAETGEVIWTFDANRPFDTVNGVEATGGSFDGPGPVFADGMMVMTSGNGGFVGRPGNVVLAFEVAE